MTNPSLAGVSQSTSTSSSVWVRNLARSRDRARDRELTGERVSAPDTFATRGEADRWLTLHRAELLRAGWTATVTGTRSFGDYAGVWLTDRQLKPRTRVHYRKLLDLQVLPTFTGRPVRSISPAMVRTWYTHLSPDTATLRAHAYGLLRAIVPLSTVATTVPASESRSQRRRGSRRRRR